MLRLLELWPYTLSSQVVVYMVSCFCLKAADAPPPGVVALYFVVSERFFMTHRVCISRGMSLSIGSC